MVQVSRRRAGHSPPATRKVQLSVSLEEADHEALSRVAARQEVSMAWVVRRAVKQYLDRQAPLFRTAGTVETAGAPKDSGPSRGGKP